MNSFINTIHCTSRTHCHACRNDRNFLASMIETFGVFSCPLSIPIGSGLEKLPHVKRRKPVPLCVHMEDTGRKVRQEDCNCQTKVVICHGVTPPQQGTSRNCRPGKCRLYVSKERQNELSDRGAAKIGHNLPR